MTKVYKITGESSTRPENLPDGFEVEESEEDFERFFANRTGTYGLHIRNHDRTFGNAPGLDLTTQYEDTDDASGTWLTDEKVKELRDALNEYLGEDGSRVVESGDREPNGSALYRDVDGDLWSYEGGQWGYTRTPGGSRYTQTYYTWNHVTSAYRGTFPWVRI